MRGGARGHRRPRRSMQKTQAGDTEMKGVGQRPGGQEKRGGRREGKADQARWVCEVSELHSPSPAGELPPLAVHTLPHSAHLFERGLHKRAQLREGLFDLYQDLEGRVGCEHSWREDLSPIPGPGEPGLTSRHCCMEGEGEAGRGDGWAVEAG